MKRKLVWLFFATVVVLATSSLVLAAQWPTASGNYQRTGFNASSVLNEARLTEAWFYVHPTHAGPVWGGVAVYNDRVFMGFNSFTAAANQIQAFNLNTGALLWTNLLTSTGTAFRGTPSAGTIGGTDYVYVGKGSAGGAAGIRCINATTGITVFDAGSGGQRIRYSQPALVDTNGDATFDIVVAGTEGGTLYAWDALTGAVAWSVVLDAGYWCVFGPSTSTDGMIVYASSWDILASGLGRVHAVDSDNGTILGTYDPAVNGIYEPEGYPASPIYVDDNTVIACGNGSLVGGNPVESGRYNILDRFAGILGQGSVNNRACFVNASVFPDPLSTDTTCIVPIENPVSVFGVPIMARARNIATMRGGGSGFRYNVFACVAADFLAEAPIAVGNSPGGEGLAIQNTEGGEYKMHVYPAHTLTGTTNFTFWQKEYAASYGFLQRTGPAVIDEASNPAGIVMVTGEGFGVVEAFNHNSVARARWQDETFCFAEIFLNVSLPFGASPPDYDTTTFYNVGDGPGSYTVGALPLAAALQGKNVTNIQVRSANYSPRRGELATKLVDEVTVTNKLSFLRKDVSTASKIQVLDEFPAVLDKSSFSLKQRESAKSAAIPVWLTVNDLSGGGPIASFGTADIELIADATTLGNGEYFATLTMTVTPDEPDPDFYGGTDIYVPIHFVVGYQKQETYVDASDASLLITNVGQIGNFEHGSGGTDAFITSFGSHNEYFAGSAIVDKNATCLWWHNNDTTGLYTADADLWTYNPVAPSSYVTQVNACSTAWFVNNAGGKDCCTLRVQLIATGLYDGAWCDSVIGLKYIYTNVGSTACDDLRIGQFCDWDIESVGANVVYGDEPHSVIWQVDDPGNAQAFGHFRMPSDDKAVVGYSVDLPTYLHPNGGHNWKSFQLDSLMALGAWDVAGAMPGPSDRGTLLTTHDVDLAPGATHVEEYIIFGWDNANGDFHGDAAFRKSVLKVWLRQHGYLRGDVNTDNRGHERNINNVDLGAAPNGGKVDVIDVVYLANYVLKATANPWPFDDQGDVNMSGAADLVDVIALANFVFKGTNVPTDYNRFGAGSRTSIYLTPAWQ
jgi:hypothetical protein